MTNNYCKIYKHNHPLILRGIPSGIVTLRVPRFTNTKKITSIFRWIGVAIQALLVGNFILYNESIISEPIANALLVLLLPLLFGINIFQNFYGNLIKNSLMKKTFKIAVCIFVALIKTIAYLMLSGLVCSLTPWFLGIILMAVFSWLSFSIDNKS